ncbi:uncharacterized protein P884DRAFT_279863 [Thermothelomyces heterothallicus CBS 202.75]|uniref:uncharacterized protein n=1 Tax=Thermothelomyces heterothallicus CBS 202.75 TaxID=1149848 RepID=UPI0037437E42
MEKARAAQVVHVMALAKHVDVEVVSQSESRSRVVKMLGGGEEGGGKGKGKRLFKLSDASGQLEFGLVKDGGSVSQADLDGNDVFVLDDAGETMWVWEGRGASKAEKAMWLKVAQAYVHKLQNVDGDDEAYLAPIAKVPEGCESAAFLRAIEAI